MVLCFSYYKCKHEKLYIKMLIVNKLHHHFAIAFAMVVTHTRATPAKNTIRLLRWLRSVDSAYITIAPPNPYPTTALEDNSSPPAILWASGIKAGNNCAVEASLFFLFLINEPTV